MTPVPVLHAIKDAFLHFLSLVFNHSSPCKLFLNVTSLLAISRCFHMFFVSYDPHDHLPRQGTNLQPRKLNLREVKPHPEPPGGTETRPDFPLPGALSPPHHFITWLLPPTGASSTSPIQIRLPNVPTTIFEKESPLSPDLDIASTPHKMTSRAPMSVFHSLPSPSA